MGIDKSTPGLRKCLVRCDCGYEGTRESQALRDGKTLECRTCYEKGRLREPQRKDLQGLVIGNLTCESFSHNIIKANGNKGSAVWNWRCECGNTTKRTKSSLETDQKNRVIRFLANLALTPGELFFAKLISSVKLLAS